PEAEVVALSPKTLMATNRFVCEICNKGFQRDQNLQLHRRGHNLPWKLRQRTNKEIKKRVYICPETSCVHHDPSRALGDLTGIKKHFCRKHGEKKWKCDKCSKRYAVQSDWKAHSKTCGTREYRCDCGTLFSRRDSFITHRAFCDALAEESARISGGINAGVGQLHNPLTLGHGVGGGAVPVMGAATPHPQSGPGTRFGGGNPLDAQFNPSVFRQPFGNNGGLNGRPRIPLWLGQGSEDEQPNPNSMDLSPPSFFNKSLLGSSDYVDETQGEKPLSALLTMTSSNTGSLYPSLFTSGSMNGPSPNLGANNDNYGGAGGVSNWTDRSSGVARLSLSTSSGLMTTSSSGNNNTIDGGSHNPSSMYGGGNGHSAQMSATALLQKAAEMGATSTNSSMHRAFVLPGSNSSSMGLGLSWQGTFQDQQRGHGMLNTNIQGGHNSNHFMKPPPEHMTEGGYSYNPSTRPSENAGLHDLMKSLSGSGGGHIGGGSFNSMQSTFSKNMGDSGNFSALNMMPPRANMKDTMQQSFDQRGSVIRPPRAIPPRNEDGSEDGLTRDFLGVGGMQVGGIHGRPPFSHHDQLAATFTSLGSAIDITSFNNHRSENMRMLDGNHGHSPVRSWDAS
ncbi:hypothetical protein KI387_037422, partial [Taxus chinensis]